MPITALQPYLGIIFLGYSKLLSFVEDGSNDIQQMRWMSSSSTNDFCSGWGAGFKLLRVAKTSEEAAAARSALACKLKDEGLTLREMGQVLAVSYQWASELAVWEGTGGRR